MSQTIVTTSSDLTGERDDRGARLTEALRDPADGASVLARVEQICGLDHRELGLGQPAEDRLRRDRRLVRRAARLEDRAEPAPLPTRLRHRRARRAALLQPAVLDRLVLAERTDVDEVDAVRREPDRALPQQQGTLADRARPGDGRARYALHSGPSVAPARPAT